MRKLKIHNYFWLGFLLVNIIHLYYLVNGEHSYVPIGDVLDGPHLWYEIANRPEFAWLPTKAIVPVTLGGVPRGVLPSQLSFISLIYQLFQPYTALAIIIWISSVIGFVGVYTLSVKFLSNTNKKYLYALLIGLLYSQLNFYPHFGLGIAGLPILANSILSIRRCGNNYHVYSIFTLYFWTSSFVWCGVYVVALLVLVYVFTLLSKKFRYLSKYLILIILFSLLLGLTFEYRLIELLLNSEFKSHRENFSIVGYSLTQSLKTALINFLIGHEHTTYLPIPLSLLVISSIFFLIKRNLVHLIIIIIPVLIVFLVRIGPLRQFISDLPLIGQVQPDRFYIFFPLLIILLILSVLKITIEQKFFAFTFLPLCLVSILSLIFLKFNFSFLGFNLNYSYKYIYLGRITLPYANYSEYYSGDAFRLLLNRYPALKNPAPNTVSIGIHPEVLQYNRINTLTGYLTIYPIQKKVDWSYIIENELHKNDEMSAYFTNWGSRMYAFSAQLFEAKNKLPVTDSLHLSYRWDKLNDIGCRYIISSHPIALSDGAPLTFLGKYEAADNYWKLHLYRLNSGSAPPDSSAQ